MTLQPKQAPAIEHSIMAHLGLDMLQPGLYRQILTDSSLADPDNYGLPSSRYITTEYSTKSAG
jgi:hypothetical protein